jgi:hypothetical protein
MNNLYVFGLSALTSFVALTILDRTGLIMHHAATLEPCTISGKSVPCSCTITNGKKFCVPVGNLSGLLTTKPPPDPLKAPPPNLIFDAAHGGGGL